jgi:hypothetical protein
MSYPRFPLTKNPQWLIRGSGGSLSSGGVRVRTLVLKDLTAGSDIADHVTAYGAGTGRRITGVLRKAITADLTVRVLKNGAEFIVITVPAATAVDTPVEEMAFTASAAVAKDDVFSWDITASDGSKDAAGVATFTLEWA